MKNTVFHISTWPSGPVRVPPVTNGPVKYSEDFLFFELSSYKNDAATAMVELPPNLYLKVLSALDLTSMSAVADFIEKHGYPSGEAGGEGPLWEDLRIACEPLGQKFAPRPLPEWDAEMLEQLRAFNGWWAYPLAEFRERAALVLDLTAVQVYLRGQQKLDELAQQWRSSLIPAPPTRPH